MKKTMKKILALVLTMLMLLSVAAPVFANTAADGCPEVHSKANLDAKGIEYTEISKHAAECCCDSAYTVYQCKGCNKYFADDIVPTTDKCETETVREATCALEGIEKCTVCGFEHKTPKTTDHEYEAEIACGNPGQITNLVCKICGDKQEGVEVTDNHVWDITVTVEPECNVPGEATYKCTNCGFTKVVEITANAKHADHNWVFGKGQKGGCFIDGTTKDTIIAGYYCKDCGVSAEAGQVIVVDGKEVTNETVYEVIEVEHTFDEEHPTYAKPETCTSSGVYFYACTECNYNTTVTVPARGHDWQQEGAEELDYSELPSREIACTEDGIGKTEYTAYCSGCGDVKLYKTHKLTEGKVVDPTCTEKGYTCDYCEICGVAYNKTNFVDPVATNHVWYSSVEEAAAAGFSGGYYVIKAPTCTEAGIAYSACKHCFMAETTTLRIAPTVHDYYVTDENGIVYDEDGAPVYQNGVYNCLTGKVVYTCTVCDEKEAGHKLEVAVPDFDFNNPEFHNIVGDATVLVKGDCKNDRKVSYTCSEHAKTIIVNEGKQHTIDAETYTPAKAPTCVENGHVGYERCTVEGCGYKKGTFGDAGIIEKLGHLYDEETYAAPVEATCTTDGNTGYGVCTREGCDHSFGVEKEEDRVIEALGHLENIVIDVNLDAYFNGFGVEATCEKYYYAHIVCTREGCDDLDGAAWEAWVDYVAATGHNFKEVVKPSCSAFGWEMCANDNCGTGVKAIQPINKVSHVDMEGNAIECVAEDFYCHECSVKEYDENGKFTGYKGAKIDAKESHQAFETVTTVKPTCAEFAYELHVCDKCKVEWTVGDMGLIEHNTKDATYKTIEEATYLTPGLREVYCGDCGTLLGTEEYTLGVEFSFDFDNALVAGANIVNSGYLAVKVYTNAYKQLVHSVDFSFGFITMTNDNFFTFEKVVVEDETSPFYGMFFAAQDGSNVNVYGTVQNDANGNVVDVELDGADQYLVTLIFKVADNANYYGTMENMAAFIAGDSIVNTVEGDVVDSAFAGYTDGDMTILGPVEEDEDGYEMPCIITINILGDVNGDATATNGSVASAVDVNKIRELIANEEYLAEADIDKDGAITVRDFEFLAEYHVGGMTYAELCMLPEIPEASEDVPGCPCCPNLQ